MQMQEQAKISAFGSLAEYGQVQDIDFDVQQCLKQNEVCALCLLQKLTTPLHKHLQTRNAKNPIPISSITSNPFEHFGDDTSSLYEN